MTTGWEQIQGKWYYFKKDNDGVNWSGPTGANMITGWEQIDGIWYYFKKDGDGVNWSGPTGSVLSNVQNVWIENKYYNFDVNGVCTNL